jgi:hypothetical protein
MIANVVIDGTEGRKSPPSRRFRVQLQRTHRVPDKIIPTTMNIGPISNETALLYELLIHSVEFGNVIPNLATTTPNTMRVIVVRIQPRNARLFAR